MAVYPIIEHEATVQVNDRTRLSAAKSYADKEGIAIVKVEIQPEAAAAFYDVTDAKEENWFTDYQYATNGTKTITVRLNGDTTPVTLTSDIVVLSEAEDALFSEDTDLVNEEPDILRYVKKGRNTFKNVHREAQSEILDYLNRKGYRTTTGSKITKEIVVDKEEVRTMSKYYTLHLIYNGLSNVVEDIFANKAATYWSKYLTASDRKIIGLDLNVDGSVDQGEGVNTRAARLIRG